MAQGSTLASPTLTLAVLQPLPHISSLKETYETSLVQILRSQKETTIYLGCSSLELEGLF